MANFLCYVSGSVTPVDSIAACLAIDPAAFVMESAAMLAQQPTLSDIFNIPVADDLQQMWMLGFSLPILTYLTTWMYGVVINWFTDDKKHW